MIENFKLKVFRVVADTLNYQRAAQELQVTQPAITAQIRSLEQGLGIALFERAGRTTSLTAAGATLLEYARQLEAVAETAEAALTPYSTHQPAVLNIGASQTLATYLLPRLLPQLQRGWPRLRLHIVSGSTTQVLEALTAHQVEVALIDAPPRRPDLKLEPFGFDELLLIARPDHRWAKKERLTAAELVKEPLLMRESGSGARYFVEEYLEENGVLRQQLRSVLDMNTTEAIISAVEAGLGIGFAPAMAVEKALKLGTVAAIPLENGPIRRELTIALPVGPDPRGPLADLLKSVRLHSMGLTAVSV